MSLRESNLVRRLTDRQSLIYAAYSVVGPLRAEHRRCPSCGKSRYRDVSSKWAARLVRCRECELLFRIPQDPPDAPERFYQRDYISGGLTTQLPPPEELERLRETGFRGTEKDFTPKLRVLAALGVPQGARVLDFGASWGYGVFQMLRAGYDASGYELSRPRAAFGAQQLGVSIEADADALRGPYDCIFSSHVLEHVPDPRQAFDLAERLLRPDGTFVAFTPNGCDVRRVRDRHAYDHSWGRLHPIYLDDRFYRHSLGDRPFLMDSREYDGWEDVQPLSRWDRRTQVTLDLSRPELLLAWVQVRGAAGRPGVR